MACPALLAEGEILRPSSPDGLRMTGNESRLPRDWLRAPRACGHARPQKSSCGQQFRVEQRRPRGAAHQVMRKERQLHIQQRAFADAADDGGHAVASVCILAGLRPVFPVVQHDGMF